MSRQYFFWVEGVADRENPYLILGSSTELPNRGVDKAAEYYGVSTDQVHPISREEFIECTGEALEQIFDEDEEGAGND